MMFATPAALAKDLHEKLSDTYECVGDAPHGLLSDLYHLQMAYSTSGFVHAPTGSALRNFLLLHYGGRGEHHPVWRYVTDTENIPGPVAALRELGMLKLVEYCCGDSAARDKVLEAAERIVGIVRHLPEVDPASVDEYSRAWLKFGDDSCALFVLGTHEGQRVVMNAIRLGTATVTTIAPDRHLGDVCLHYEPEHVADVLRRYEVHALLRPCAFPVGEMTHPAGVVDGQLTDTELELRVFLRYAANGTPAERLARMLESIVDSALGDGRFTGDSDAELVESQVRVRVLDQPSNDDV